MTPEVIREEKLRRESVGMAWPGTVPETSSAYVHPAALVETERIGEGTRVWAFTHIASGATVGNNWAEFAMVCGTTDGLIYPVTTREVDPTTGRQSGGDLLWYQHLGRLDGTFSWAPQSPTPVGNGWHQFRFVFAN